VVRHVGGPVVLGALGVGVAEVCAGLDVGAAGLVAAGYLGAVFGVQRLETLGRLALGTPEIRLALDKAVVRAVDLDFDVDFAALIDQLTDAAAQLILFSLDVGEGSLWHFATST
jgi:hypothetical protein